VSGAGMYYYVIDEYRVSNQLLTEDIYVRPHTFPNYKFVDSFLTCIQALQSAVQRIEAYVRTLEEKVDKKKR
jgi:hypothetical protein